MLEQVLTKPRVPDTPQHRYYDCRCLRQASGDKLIDDIIAKTNHLCRHAARYKFTPSVLWFRGVLPYSWSFALADSASYSWSSQPPASFHAGGAGYSDGAGAGKDQAVPRFAQKVGAGAAVFHWAEGTGYTHLWCGLSSVPLRQTVPRAETVGLHMCQSASAKVW